jgi:hypothetical protein
MCLAEIVHPQQQLPCTYLTQSTDYGKIVELMGLIFTRGHNPTLLYLLWPHLPLCNTLLYCIFWLFYAKDNLVKPPWGLHTTSWMVYKYQCYQHRQRQNIAEGPKTKISAISGKISVNIGKCRKNEKNTKIFFFFQFFKYLKHQQHQINAFPHKYEKRIHI